MAKITIKEHLFQSCTAQVVEKYKTIQDKIKGIVASLEDATKSSAGDKHETARAMLQIDREQAGERLAEIEKTFEVLYKIDITSAPTHAHLGSLVTTNQGRFFLSISLGVLQHENVSFFCIGLQTPIGKVLLGKQEGDSFVFRDTTYSISSIS
jgi:transcription elongation GreA/GreB family factor